MDPLVYRVLRSLTARDRWLLCAHYGIGRKRLPAHLIAAHLGISRQHVYRRLQACYTHAERILKIIQ